jgi:AcrR family transcriptional regulator
MSSCRERILHAARLELAERGYEGTSLRGVARRARVDIRLVHHYFGPKSRLAQAATQLTGPVMTPLTAPGPSDAADSPGARIARQLMSACSSDSCRLAWQALMASAMTHEPTAARLTSMLTGWVTELAEPSPATAATVATADPADLRRAALASQLLGLSVLVAARDLDRETKGPLLARVFDACLPDHRAGSGHAA